MDKRTLRRIGIAVAAATLAAACADSPAGPSMGGGNGGGAATITSVTIGGATSVTVGGTAQLTATANKSDGTTENVTNTATWQSSDATIMTVSATGLATALRAGSADISATVGGQMGRRTVQAALARFQVAVALQGATALSTCDDVTQGLTNGEFALRAVAVTQTGATQTLASTTSYPGNPSGPQGYNLSEGETQSLSGTASFTLTGETGQFVRVEFRATEWDEQIVIIPPSIRWIHDDRMDDRSLSRTHSYTNGGFSSAGPNSLTIGNSSCGIRLNYSVTVTPQ